MMEKFSGQQLHHMFFGIHFCSDRLQNGSSGRISLIRIKKSTPNLPEVHRFPHPEAQKSVHDRETPDPRSRAFIEQALYRDKSDGGDDGTVVFKIEKEISLIKRE